MNCRHFEFGENWLGFATKSLDTAKADQARKDFDQLIDGIKLAGKSFLDVGFGQGLTLLAAAERHAKVVGLDLDPKCVQAVKSSHVFFPTVEMRSISIVSGSILDKKTLQTLAHSSPQSDGLYDIVHAWGVLHHTSDMKRAITNCARLVRKNGILIIAIYNRHWTSPIWHGIKKVYNLSNRRTKRAMVLILFPVIYAAKWVVTHRNPTEMTRGMDFWFDVVDWVGGFPYEYAATDEIESMLAGLGFYTLSVRPANVPTGCNEFVLKKK
jgi:2-polyprenyl-6-hydroxyphenyl methylase/3-demethylubiquinone-9 3-methyltransferase